MTLGEARYVWSNRSAYDEATVSYALQILEHAGEM